MAAKFKRALGLLYIVLAVGTGMIVCAWATAAQDNGEGVQITRLPPDPRGGQAYRLAYTVPLPAEIFWRFKTDFENSFLEDNKHILEHKLVYRQGNKVITENRYKNQPNALFRWQTTVFPQSLRLEFKLINPSRVGHQFHYGFIQLNPKGQATQVIQVAYFDFAGAFLWSHYPWRGGMKAFLKYTVKWERETALRLREQYSR